MDIFCSANDFSFYTRSKSEAKSKGNETYVYLRDKLDLPINRDKSEIRRPSNFKVVGHGFIPIYKKAVKGHYQLIVTKQRWESLKSKLKRVTRKCCHTV